MSRPQSRAQGRNAENTKKSGRKNSAASQAKLLPEIQSKPIDLLENEILEFTAEEKYEQLKKNYVLLYDSAKLYKEGHDELVVKFHNVDAISEELNKNVLLRQKLENVCRELQNQNKKIKEEYTEKLRSEEEYRKSTAHQFQSRLLDLSKLLQDSKIQSEQAHKDNQNMGVKLNELCKQFQTREAELIAKAVESENAQKKFHAEIEKIHIQRQGEKLLHQKEIETLLLKLKTSDDECILLRKATQSMQKHLDEYKNRYSEIESNLVKSTQMFEKCKNEMTTMAEHLRQLETENVVMKKKMNDHYKSIATANELSKKQDASIAWLEKKCEQLQKLCRQVQVDRSYYLKLLRANNIQIENAADQEQITGPQHSSVDMQGGNQVTPVTSQVENGEQPQQEISNNLP